VIEGDLADVVDAVIAWQQAARLESAEARL
jgi:hypothetical protein